MKRRLFLKGVAGASLAAPFLASMQTPARAQTATPRRLVIFYTSNGCLTNRWFPSVENGPLTAAALAGKTLEPLSDVVDKLLVPRGTAMIPSGFNVEVNGIKYFDPHDQGMGSKLTGGPIDPENKHYALQRSLDHQVAEIFNPVTKTPLVLSVGFSSSDVKSVVSYKAAGEPYLPETKASNVYNTLSGLFGTGTTQAPTEADYRVKQGKSVIDLVKGDLETFQRLPMSGGDQKKVTDWLALLRETEIQVVSAACNADAVTQLGIDPASVASSGGGGGGFGGGDTQTQFEQGGDTMIKLIALTMMCDANRSILMQWPGFVTFSWLGHTKDHHGLSHRVGSAAVSGPCVDGVVEMIGQIDTWYASRYSQLVHLINSVQEGEGVTMLDNSAVMWLPELADGNAHNNNNLPIVIAGSMGGYLKQGEAVNVDTSGRELGTGDSEASCKNPGDEVSFNTGSNSGTKVPLQKLYVTLLNGMGNDPATGQPFQSFGTADSNDVAAGITNPGELTALRAT